MTDHMEDHDEIAQLRAEIERLKAQVKLALTEIDRLHSLPDEMRSCGELSCDDCNARTEQLRAKLAMVRDALETIKRETDDHNAYHSAEKILADIDASAVTAFQIRITRRRGTMQSKRKCCRTCRSFKGFDSHGAGFCRHHESKIALPDSDFFCVFWKKRVRRNPKRRDHAKD